MSGSERAPDRQAAKPATGLAGEDPAGADTEDSFLEAVRAIPSAPDGVAPLTPPPHLAVSSTEPAGPGRFLPGAVDDLVEATRSGRVSVQERIDATLASIRSANQANNAFISVLGERAIQCAEALDASRENGEAQDLPLLGVPIAVKDCISIEGVPNTCGTAGRRHTLATQTAPAVAALEAAGAVVVGTANLHEWAFGATSRNEAYGAVLNPHDDGRVPGGSSGGSAVAVATGMASVALGTDTGGSIRLPASYCGIAGLKVTTGSVSTEGCYPLSWTMDSIGPLARTVADLAMPLDVLLATGGRQFQDRSLPPLAELRVGVWPGARETGRSDDGVRASFRDALAVFEGNAASVLEIELPDLALITAAQLGIITSEAAAVHSPNEVDRGSYEENVRELLALGDAVPARDYVNALRHRQVVWQQLEALFSQVDVIVSPTTPCVAPLIGQESIDWPDGSSESVLGASIRYLLLWNFVGAPALSMPCGMSDGLPVGLQVAAAPGSDRSLVRLGAEIESVLSDADREHCGPGTRG